MSEFLSKGEITKRTGSFKQTGTDNSSRSHSVTQPTTYFSACEIPLRATFSNSFRFNYIESDGAPGETRTRDPLLRRYAVQNSKCRFWCRLRGSASFISPLNWTEVGLKHGAKRTRRRPKKSLGK